MSEIFGRLTTTGLVEMRGRKYVQVSCTCGTVKFVTENNLKTGGATSCGCLRRERAASANTRHGHAGRGQLSKAYHTWQGMRNRCSNPNGLDYAYYGGRGITFDPRWHSFAAFLADMGEPPQGTTLDRKDNSLGYSKDNCRWATRTEQANNQRNNVRIEYEGKFYRIQEIAEIHGISYDAVRYRRNKGWSPEQLIKGCR